jgi:hypothetical protein
MMLAVVKYVAMPPTSVPKDRGISSLEGGTFACRPTCTAAGNNTAPAAMLFITSESAAPAAMNSTIRRASEPPPMRRRRSAIARTTPVSSSPCVIMNRPMMVITAERLKPESASWKLTSPARGSAIRISRATRSARTRPEPMASSATAMIPISAHSCDESTCSPPPPAVPVGPVERPPRL